MYGYDRFDDHAERVGRMADALGVDLDEEMQAGRLPVEDLQATVYRCLGCSEIGECSDFLAATDPGKASGAPGYCRNKHQLEAMRDR